MRLPTQSRLPIAAPVFCVLALAGTAAVACMGTPRPVCARTIYLAMAAPQNAVAIPNVDAQVPLGLIPFANWSSACPAPVSHQLQLELQQPPRPGRTVGARNTFIVPLDALPQPTGIQNVPKPFVLTVPANFVDPADLPVKLDVMGTYQITFGAGVSPATISATRAVQICLVEPVPGTTIPRLSMSQISPTGDLYQVCRRGDQAIFDCVATNNDPLHGVTLDLNSEGMQTAGLPDGIATPLAAYTQSTFAVSDVTPGHDTYPAAFADTLDTWELVPDGDPTVPDPRLLMTSMTLGPLESRIVRIAMKSYGMCADGSCNMRTIELTGQYNDGSRALACITKALVVGDVPGKSPLCEITDTLKGGLESFTFWSPADYLDGTGAVIPHSSTHAVGNLDPRSEPGTGVPPGPTKFHVDYLRTEKAPAGVRYDVGGSFFSGMMSRSVGNNVHISGLDRMPLCAPARLPLISLTNQTFSGLDVSVNLGQDQIQISQMSSPLFTGQFSQFLKQAPTEFTVHHEICRQFEKGGELGGRCMGGTPLAFERLFKNKKSAKKKMDRFRVRTAGGSGVAAQAGMRWKASVQGGFLELEETKGKLSDPVVVRYKKNRLTDQAQVGYLIVEVKGAVNSPFSVPIVARLK